MNNTKNINANIEDIKFEDDPEAVGKWVIIGEYDTKEDFLSGINRKDNMYGKELKEIYFLPNGRRYWIYGWTKGLIIFKNGDYTAANPYTIEEINGEKYMFVEWKSYEYIQEGKETVLVLKQSDNKKYTLDEISRTDDIDKPFADDKKILGKWKAVAFLHNKEEYFNPNDSNDRLFYKNMEFKENGKFTRNGVDTSLWATWTKGYLLTNAGNGTEQTSEKYEFKTIDGKEYLFIEWKTGDYVWGGWDPTYNVFVRDDKTNEYIETLQGICSRYELPAKLNSDIINEFVSEPGSLKSIWGLCCKDLSNVDFSEVNENEFIRLAFNHYTKFPENFKFDYMKIMEYAKDPGLGIRNLHKQGIDGKGINVAVIDKPILDTHKEFTGRIKEYVFINPDNEHNDEMHFHGITCASFLCGNTCGVANRTNLYYYAYPDRFEDDGMYWNYHFKALDMIKEHNEKSNAKDKIKIVSISAGFPRSRTDLTEKMDGYVREFKNTGCYIIFSNIFGETFTCSSKTYIENANDFDAYKLDMWQENEWCKQKILIPSGGKTSPCNSGDENFMYNGNQSCFSWAIPYMCGVFALALQVKTDLSYEDFCVLAKETTYKNNVGLFVINPREIINRLSK